MSNVKQYVVVCPLLTDRYGAYKRTVLVKRKGKVEKWQAGQWNLPGGKVKAGEQPYDAAIRELREEAGMELDGSSIKLVGSFSGDKNRDTGKLKKWNVRIYVGVVKEILDGWPIDEEIRIIEPYQIWQYNLRIIPNLYFIIPLCFTVMDNFKLHTEAGNICL